MNSYHTPVLLSETLDYLDIKPGDTVVDCTLGGGGHSEKILEKLNTVGTLIGFDRDEDAILNCEKRFEKYDNKILIKSNYSHLKEELESRGIFSVDKILFDLGVSSHQLDADRGFSFQRDEPLDMRMDRTSSEHTAAWYVNNLPEEELADIIYKYGEERLSRRVAKSICSARIERRINSTLDLAEIIKKSIGFAYFKQNIHPATRTFQALRIEVNKELEHIEPALTDAASILKEGGILAVISFHSLEDRIVKRTFQKLAGKCTCPPEIPFCICNPQKTVDILTNKPVIPDDKEIRDNPRARSSKLRCVRKSEVS